MDEAYEKATVIIKEHRDLLDLIAKELLEKETIEAKDFVALLGERPGNNHSNEEPKV